MRLEGKISAWNGITDKLDIKKITQEERLQIEKKVTANMHDSSSLPVVSTVQSSTS